MEAGTQQCSPLYQASALEERLRETEEKLKKSQEGAQAQIQRLTDTNSQLVSFFVNGKLYSFTCLVTLVPCCKEST